MRQEAWKGCWALGWLMGLHAGLIASWAVRAQAEVGLATRWAEVAVGGLEPGRTYNISKLRNLPLIVTNTSTIPVELEINPEAPPPGGFSKNYEPVPDPSWVQVIPSRFRLGSGESSYSEVIVRIPAEERYKNRHYQVLLRSKTVNIGGTIAVAVTSKFYISTGDPPESTKKGLELPEIELSPVTLTLGNVAVGREVNVKKEHRASLRLLNKSERKTKVRLKVLGKGANHPVPPEYELAPEPSWLKLEKPQMKVRPGRIEDVRFRLSLPKEAKGKKYAFVVKGELGDSDVVLELRSTVLVTAEK